MEYVNGGYQTFDFRGYAPNVEFSLDDAIVESIKNSTGKIVYLSFNQNNGVNTEICTPASVYALASTAYIGGFYPYSSTRIYACIISVSLNNKTATLYLSEMNPFSQRFTSHSSNLINYDGSSTEKIYEVPGTYMRMITVSTPAESGGILTVNAHSTGGIVGAITKFKSTSDTVVTHLLTVPSGVKLSFTYTGSGTAEAFLYN